MSERWQRLEAIYHDALAQPPAQRAAFVTAACAGDAALEREALALLANAASAASFLERSADRAAPVTLVGRQLGAFAVEAQIGAGGMGEVYRAKDTRLGRTVAVKVLPRDLAADPDRRQRFQREARAVAALNHPNICTVHDVGHDEGLDFLVMELVEGESLATRLAKGPLPLDQALARAMEIADALDKAHRQGIIHRDLKPGNVMLTKHGAKVLDFGLARFVRRRHGRACGAGADRNCPADRSGRRARYAPVHGARADRRPPSRRAHGHLRVRGAALRDAHGPAGLRGRRARPR